MSVKLYEINGEWLTWDHLHNVLGYTMAPSVAVSYKSAAHDTWGEDAGNGYVLNGNGELSQWSMWSEGVVGWFGANGLAEQGVYPASSANLFLERTGETAKAVSLDDGVNTYYLIDGYLDLGWRLWEVLEAEGWQISSGGELAYIIVDEDTGEIVFSQNDPGMEFAEVWTLLIPDSEMILVPEASLPLATFYLNPEGRDATENHTLSLADNPVFDANGNNILYADYPDLQGERPFCFMRVDNTFFVGGEGDSLINFSEGKAGIGAFASRGKSAWSVSFEVQPSELTAYFTNAGAAGTSDTRIGGDFGSTPATLYDASGNPLLYDLSKKYTILGMYNYSGSSVEVSSYSTIKDTNGVVQYIPSGIKNVFTIVFSLSPQTTIDAYFTNLGANETSNTFCSNNLTYTMYDSNGVPIPYDSTKTYTTVATFVVNGNTASSDFAGGYADWSDTVLKGRPNGNKDCYKVVIRVE